jgi:hypothetical protein
MVPCKKNQERGENKQSDRNPRSAQIIGELRLDPIRILEDMFL